MHETEATTATSRPVRSDEVADGPESVRCRRSDESFFDMSASGCTPRAGSSRSTRRSTRPRCRGRTRGTRYSAASVLLCAITSAGRCSFYNRPRHRRRLAVPVAPRIVWKRFPAATDSAILAEGLIAHGRVVFRGLERAHWSSVAVARCRKRRVAAPSLLAASVRCVVAAALLVSGTAPRRHRRPAVDTCVPTHASSKGVPARTAGPARRHGQLLAELDRSAGPELDTTSSDTEMNGVPVTPVKPSIVVPAGSRCPCRSAAG